MQKYEKKWLEGKKWRQMEGKLTYRQRLEMPPPGAIAQDDPPKGLGSRT